MRRPLGVALGLVIAFTAVLTAPPGVSAKPEGTLTVAVATCGNERWLPNLYVGAEDDIHTLSVRFDKPFVVFGSKVNQGLFYRGAYTKGTGP